MARTINTSSAVPSDSSSTCYKYSSINTRDLPKPVFMLPEECTNLPKTAKHQIQALQNQLEGYYATEHKQRQPHTNLTELQDAIDDGFLLCDLKTIQRKLIAWKIMFPRIKPFFAIKCNPDCMVSHILGQTVLINDDVNGGNGDNGDKSSNCSGSSGTPCCGFDCASLAEIQLALRSSYCDTTTSKNTTTDLNTHANAKTNTETKAKTSPCQNVQKSIVYANPQRSIHDLDQALELGVHALTFDSVEELYKVKDAYERLLAKRRKQSEDQSRNENQDDPNCNGGGGGRIGENNVLLMSPTNEISPPEMIVRIVVPDTHSTVPLGEKFGVEPTLVRQLTQKALELNLNVIGVSFHCGSGNHDPTSYRDAIVIAKSCIDEMNAILRQFGKDDCCVLDIGGGYPGYDGVGGDFGRFSSGNSTKNRAVDSLGLEMNEKYDGGNDTAYNIAQVVSPLIDELFPLHEENIDIISEPGRYFVEAAFAYCARIYSVKKAGQEQFNGDDNHSSVGCNHYYIAQGVQGLFKDVILCDEVFTPIPLRINADTDGNSLNEENNKSNDTENNGVKQLFPSIVHGPSGESFDIVCKNCMLPQLKEGDWLLFDRMGAYTLSIAARNSSLPIKYII